MNVLEPKLSFDLANYSSPIASIFEQPTSAKGWEPDILSEEQVAVFDNKVANELPRGYASFHHPLMMHGSYANDSERPRRAVVLNAMADGTLGNTAGYERMDALHNFPAMPHNQVLDSHFFPLLFDGDKELEILKNVPKVERGNSYKII